MTGLCIQDSIKCKDGVRAFGRKSHEKENALRGAAAFAVRVRAEGNNRGGAFYFANGKVEKRLELDREGVLVIEI